MDATLFEELVHLTVGGERKDAVAIGWRATTSRVLTPMEPVAPAP
jgi:hypothetical protein